MVRHGLGGLAADRDRIDVLCLGGVDGGLVGADDRFRVEAVPSPAEPTPEAVAETIPDRPFDCLVLGDSIPQHGEHSGWDVLATVGAVRERFPDRPVAVVAADVDAAEAIDAGATVFAGLDEGVSVLAHRLARAVEHYRAREGVADRERLLEGLLHHASDRVSVLDEAGRYRFVSPAMERLMGYDQTELLGESGFEYVHPEDRKRAREMFERVIEHPDEVGEVEYRFRHADGTWRWVESRGKNCLGDPAIDGIVINSRDITERKEREQKLRDERAFTESVLGALPDVLYAFDEQGEFLRWNDQLAAVTGYDDEEIAEMHPTEFIAADDRARVATAIADVFTEDRTVTVEARFETKSGEVLPYEFTGAQLTGAEGETLGLVGIGRDISSRKERERRFEAVFDNTYQFTGLLEPDGTLIEANATALEFAGVDREAVVGQKLWETAWFGTGEAEESAREAVETARDGELFRDEIVAQGAEETAYIDFSVRPIFDDEGEVTLLIPEGRNITELKQREQHLGVLHRFLRHNLRNKITVIKGTTALLRSELADTEYADHLEQILGSARELIELSETANELSKIAIQADTDPEPVDLQASLDRTVSEIRERYPDAAVTVADQGDWTVRADWRLDTLFEQLLENAVEHGSTSPDSRARQDAVEHGSTSPDSRARQDAVEISIQESEEFVSVRIADQGPGIPEDELAGIVTAEEQTQLTHGTGFGLWLVRSVVDDYGGRLAHESRPAGGSVLIVRLQKAPSAPTVSESSAGTS